MALHFEREEFEARLDRLRYRMQEEKLDAMLLFSQESMYWLTGYDTFGFVFFQCLVVILSHHEHSGQIVWRLHPN